MQQGSLTHCLGRRFFIKAEALWEERYNAADSSNLQSNQIKGNKLPKKWVVKVYDINEELKISSKKG
jgi:hypothetical protein